MISIIILYNHISETDNVSAAFLSNMPQLPQANIEVNTNMFFFNYLVSFLNLNEKIKKLKSIDLALIDLIGDFQGIYIFLLKIYKYILFISKKVLFISNIVYNIDKGNQICKGVIAENN